MKKCGDGHGNNFYRCNVGPGLRASLGNAARVGDLIEGQAMVSVPVQNPDLGLRALQVYRENDMLLSNPLRTVFLAFGDRPIRAVVVSAKPQERFAFQLACWLADSSGMVPAPQDLEIPLAERIKLPKYPVNPIQFVEEENIPSANAGPIAKMVYLTRTDQGMTTLPSVQRSGQGFVTDPTSVLFKSLPKISELEPRQLTGMALRAETSEGAKLLGVIGQTGTDLESEDILLDLFQPTARKRNTPYYEKVRFTGWLREAVARPPFFAVKKLGPAHGGAGFRVALGMPGRSGIEAYVAKEDTPLQINGQPYVVIGAGRRESEVEVYGRGRDDQLSYMMSVVRESGAPDLGRVEKPGRRNDQLRREVSQQYRDFFAGERSIDEVPMIFRRIKKVSHRSVGVNNRAIHFPIDIEPVNDTAILTRRPTGEVEIWVDTAEGRKLAKIVQDIPTSCDLGVSRKISVFYSQRIRFNDVFVNIQPGSVDTELFVIVPYLSKDGARGIQIWAAKDGQRIGEQPVASQIFSQGLDGNLDDLEVERLALAGSF
ncbi:MAG: hypothetical protein JW782_05675 [Candidatus Saganbacteria bacterium]|nr:hypothetical protein [Candidatus Saganbacteria bacterium]